MLLVIDVGNTNTVIGLYDGERLLADWRIETRPGRTADENRLLLRQFLAAEQGELQAVHGAIIACVVPPAQDALERAIVSTFAVQPLLVGPGIRTGMPILMDNPKEVGADRIVNAVAAWEREHAACIVVDFGTATTFDVISPAGEYLGGAICPGLVISADALYRHAAKLPRVQLERPRRVVGKGTVESMQVGLIYGYAALVDGLVERMRAELKFPLRVYATGGQAIIVAEACRHIDVVDDTLTLEGLRLLYAMNAGPGQTP
jgi:type III pantothenate kinase